MPSMRRALRSLIGRGKVSTSGSDDAISLEEAGVPLVSLEDACKACEAPCDLGQYPNKFDVDMDSEMLGTTKPYARQVIISSGLINWPHEVTEEKGSLAALLHAADRKLSKKPKPGGNSTASIPAAVKVDGAAVESPLEENMRVQQHSAESEPPTAAPTAREVLSSSAPIKNEKKEAPSPALFDTREFSRVSILNGSHRSTSEGHMRYTAIILPDWKFVDEIAVTSEDAEKLWRTTLDPAVGRAGVLEASNGTANSFRSQTLPYDCVILLCSHKKRDNKCGIAAPILENAVTKILEARHWEVHSQIAEDGLEEPLEDFSGDEQEREANFEKRIRAHATHASQHGKKALIVKTSHIGGHRYAGNMIICSPNGATVWYGRVSPKEITAVVDETVIGGRVIPELLRAGVNFSRTNGHGLYDW